MERTLTIKINDDLREKVKIKAIKEGKSLKEYIIKLLEKDIKKEG